MRKTGICERARERNWTAVSGCGGACTDPSAVSLAVEELGQREGAAKWEGIMLKVKREFFGRRKTSFAQRATRFLKKKRSVSAAWTEKKKVELPSA